MASTVVVHLVDASGRPFPISPQRQSAVSVLFSDGKEAHFYDEARSGLIEIPIPAGQENFPIEVWPSETDTTKPSPAGWQQIIPKDGKEITIQQLRPGEVHSESAPIGFFGGLLIGSAVAAVAFAALHYMEVKS